MSAIFSPCETWRYRLDRELEGGGPPVAFCLHNPSKADAEKEDPTSARGVSFANAWGARRLTYVNPWAAVQTKSKKLWDFADPIGPENDFHICTVAREIAEAGGFCVAAWGAISPPARLRAGAHERILTVERLIRATGCEMRALGFTAAGHPRHPLYLRSSAEPRIWRDFNV